MTERQDQLDELLDRWEAAREQGEFLSPEALCREYPALLDELREQIEALVWMPPVPEALGLEADSANSCFADSPDKHHGDPPNTLARYELLDLIGAGGFGQVWKAYDPDLQRYVAIKIPHLDHGPNTGATVERILEEARRVARLTHPHIVPVFDVVRQDGWCYIVSDLVAGTSLRERLRAGELPCDEAVRIAANVAAALDHAHKQGLVHRDVKCGNILLGIDDQVFLADFGIAALEDELRESSEASGTLAYMSPEQVRGELLNNRSDIFSLGVVLYEMLTGRHPFGSPNPSEVREAILNTNPQFPSDVDDRVPTWISDVCLKAIAKDPGERYASCEEFGEALGSGDGQPLRPGNATQRWGLNSVNASVLVVVFSVLTLTAWMLGIVPGRSGREQPAGSNSTATAAEIPEVEELPRTFRWYRFDDPLSRWKNIGGLGGKHLLRTRGSFSLTTKDDPDAPPSSLGTGVRFNDGTHGEALLPNKNWLFNDQWTMSFWFRRERSDNDDFLLHLGETYGKGGGRCPQFNIWLTPQGDLRILNQKSFRTKDIDVDFVFPAVANSQWHLLTLAFDSPNGPAHLKTGTLSVFLDGKEIAHRLPIYIGIAARDSKSKLVVGSVNRPGIHSDRAFHGVLADLRFFHVALEPKVIKELWHDGQPQGKLSVADASPKSNAK